MNLNDLRDAAYQDAVDHGLYKWTERVQHLKYVALLLISRIGCEVAEARKEAEKWKEGAPDFDEENLKQEFADIIIMTLSACGKLGIDIDAEVKKKMAANKERPWMHKEK